MSSNIFQNGMEIIERLKDAYKLKTDTALAEFLDVPQSTLANWKRRGSLNLELIISKCDELNQNWLLFGEKPIWKKNVYSKIELPEEGDFTSEPGIEYIDDTKKVKWSREDSDDFKRLLSWVMPSDMPMKDKITIIEAFRIATNNKNQKLDPDKIKP